MINRVILNETSYFGIGSREKLKEEIAKRSYKKALVITDNNLIKANVTSKVTKILDEINFPYEIFSDIKPNPTVDNVLKGVESCKNSNADFIIAVGGGSPIDTAKAVGIIMTNEEFSDVVSLDGVANTKNPSMPIIALPTTSGTAAEVTINYVITDEANTKKMVCVDPHDIPVVAIIDAELMKNMPRGVAASTGMDALTHAMEGFITKGAWEMSDMFHKQSIKMTYDNLAKAVNKLDLKAIENMGLSQYIAGMGFSNVGLGIVHSMAHALGAVYDTPHGLANAILLPYVLEYNGKVCVNKYREILTLFGENEKLLQTDEEVISKVAYLVMKLGVTVGIPNKLIKVNVKEEDLYLLAKKAYEDVCTPGNPRETSVEDILEIFKRAY